MPSKPPRVERRPPARTIGTHVAVMLLQLRGLPTTSDTVELVEARCALPIRQLQQIGQELDRWLDGEPVGLRIREA